MKPARLVLVDPPWQLDDALGKRGAGAHYTTMTVDELCAYKLPPVTDDVLLAMWRLSSMQVEALQVLAAWGYGVKSEMVWNKLTKTGKRWFGMGRYVRNSHETCLLATLGGRAVSVGDRSVRSTFDAVALEHSRKPDAFYDLLERLVPQGPYVEVFARRARKGWRCIGNELKGVDSRQLALPHTTQRRKARRHDDALVAFTSRALKAERDRLAEVVGA